MRMGTGFVVAAAAAFFALAAPAFAGMTIDVVAQPDSPVTVTSYNARFIESSSSYSGFPGVVLHELGYRNSGKRDIEAVEFAFYCFNLWDEPMTNWYQNTYSSTSIGPRTQVVKDLASNGSDELSYIAWSGDQTISMIRSSIVYVCRVRFADGGVWNCDEEAIKSKLSDKFPGLATATPAGG